MFFWKGNRLANAKNLYGLSTTRKQFSSLKSFATVDPWKLSKANPHTVLNYISGEWKASANTEVIVDPLNGDAFLNVSNTNVNELKPFQDSLNSCTKSGLHNPFKSPERYVKYGSVSAKAACMLAEPEVEDFFVKLIQRVAPKSDFQARGEVRVTQKFLENFGGDQVRFLARSFQVPGDHAGQMSSGYRWPYGPTVIIAPFNFPIEIPVLQLMGSLYMGNKVTFKNCSKVSVVMEQTIRMLLACGLPAGDLDFINCDGPTMQTFIHNTQPRMTQFTGSSKIGEILAKETNGKIKLEDAGWDWKVLGPDVSNIDYVAWSSDQDAYAYSGQKCSAQSALFIHENWTKAGFLDKIKTLAERRSLKDLTLGPVLTVNNDVFLKHVAAVKEVPGAKVLFGGKLLSKDAHSIPAQYGSFEPTAIQIPIHEFLKEKYFELCTTEIFGPFQVVIEYADDELDLVLEALERCTAHLTAAIVSTDVEFQHKVLGNTVNGTTYCGIRARTTGAPQNHWFGPAGDPRGAGIGTAEAIKLVWSCHREVVTDQIVRAEWKTPAAT